MLDAAAFSAVAECGGRSQHDEDEAPGHLRGFRREVEGVGCGYSRSDFVDSQLDRLRKVVLALLALLSPVPG